MKSTTLLMITCAFALFTISTSSAQGVLSGLDKQAESLKDNISKSEVVETMSDFEGLDLTDKEKSGVKDVSSELVGDLFDIAGGGFAPDIMKGKLKDLKKKSDKMFKNVLGEKKLKKYKKSIKKKMRPLTRKAKLLSWLL